MMATIIRLTNRAFHRHPASDGADEQSGRSVISTLEFSAALLAAIALGSLLGFAPAAARAQEKIVISSSSAYTQMPNRVGVEKGFFKEQGLDPEFKILPSGNNVVQALAGGSADFGDAAPSLFLAAIANKLPIVAIALHSWGNIGKLVASKANENLTDLNDFKGKHIGAQVGTGAYVVLMLAIDHAGLKESDFKFSNIRVSEMPGAMQAGGFDAVMAWEPEASRIVQTGLGKEVISSKKFEELAHTTYPFLVLTTEKMIRERPEVVQKYMNGFAKAQRFMLENEKQAGEIYRNSLPPEIGKQMTEAELHFQLYSSSRYDHLVLNDRDLSDLRQFTEFMLRQKMLNSKPELASSINMTFAQKAAAALGK